ncbi:dorsal-ventral patterning protein Sog-like precursor [Parasteatoda tepidariorum]|uniref:Short gastrulation n=2 Tax=Parasteatoda tepidariorum TaxID=114398 RepID=Q25C48_PARTP|nr:dorsal-ventral patterning protein Sog-like precursor [Parasteatoda tepidariorum]BAE87096.1 Short gastrulation [Parasteatoda tepidariorum]
MNVRKQSVCGLFTFILCCSCVMVSSAVTKKVRPPLVEEVGRRKLEKQTHCQFGNNTYELEERWRPDLGPPFGMLYCMRCECIPVQRKRRIMSKVRCKNIKNDCPKPTCDDPVLLPQRCCKTCPGEDYADLEEDIATRKLESEDEDKILKEYTALLTGKILVPRVSVSGEAVSRATVAGAARGYFVFTKRDLHYTINYRGIPRPASVRFTNEEGNILEEHEIPIAPHHVQGSKVCGVWRRVPKVYRRLLQKEKLIFILVTSSHADGIVGGRIMKHNSINTEAYGTLLLPSIKSGDLANETQGTGGMANIFPVTDSIHVSLGFNGIFTAEDIRDVPLIVSLFYEDMDGKLLPISESLISLPKVHPHYNSATVKLDLAPHLQERLSSGKFELRISSKDGQRLQSGRIMPKVTCNVFEAVITPTEIIDTSKDPITGFIILDIGSEGFINYKLHVSDPSIESATIRLETKVETPNGTGMRVLQQVSQNLTNSWGNGTFSRRSIQEMEMMLSDDLVVTVLADTPNTVVHSATPEYRSSIIHRPFPPLPESLGRSSRVTRSDKVRMQLRGQVHQRLYTDALINEMPILLTGGNTTAGGIAWLSIDKDCILHYQVYLTGLDARERHLLELLQVRPGKYHHPLQRVLKKFEGEQVMVEDLAEDLDGRSLAFIQQGYTYLVVTSKLNSKAKAVELRAKINELYTPPNCLPSYDASSKTRSGNTYQDGYNDVYGTDLRNTCEYEGTIYDDGDHWKGEHEECTMCSCQRGRVVCERTICPKPLCNNPMTMEGECCPFCPSNSNGSSEVDVHKGERYCFFDKKYRPAGIRWHPYVPPFGFSKCSLCTCDPKTLTVKCDRITCPALTCAEKDAYREQDNDCCKKCPNSVLTKAIVIIPPSVGHLGDQSGEKSTVKEILNAGGCKFRGQVHRNGDEWHPTIEPYGAEKCVKCHCKDGRAKCKRKKCPKESCPVKVPGEDGCCDRCIDSVSESSSRSAEGPSKGKRRRKERERRHRKVRQPKEKQN